MAVETGAATMGSSLLLPPTEKLKGISDYHNWKFIMKMVLIHEDLWDCVTDEKSLDDKKNMKALAKICLAVSSSAYTHVRNAKTPCEAWQNLQRAYEDKGLCRRLGLLRNLFSAKLGDVDSMDKYLSSITETSQQLCDIGSPLEDDFLAVIMLSGLPSDYDPLIMALENNNIKLSSENVKAKLLQEYQRRCGSIDNATTTAFAAKEKKRTVICFKCKKPGHVMRYCTEVKNSTTEEQEKGKASLTALSVHVKNDVWCIDSGATNHMCNNKSVISDYMPMTPTQVTVANGEKLAAVGQGNVKVKLRDCIKTISGVYFVPGLTANLLSVSAMTMKGFDILFRKDICKIIDQNKTVATATHVNKVYQLDTLDTLTCNSALESVQFPLCLASENVVSSQVTSDVPIPVATPDTVDRLDTPASSALAAGCKATQETWHRRLAHLNSRSMRLMKQGMVVGIDYDDSNYNSCIACVEGKQFRLPFPKASQNRSTEVLGLIHSDVCGPMSQNSLGGAKYFLTFTDDYTRRTIVYFLKYKTEVFEKFKLFKALVEKQTGKKLKILRSDNGGEFCNSKFQAYLKDQGVIHETTVPYSPAQNGVSERANRTIMEKARCMLRDAGLNKSFWAEAVQTAVYIKNRTPTRAVMGSTPEEKWSGKKVNVSHFKVFGCLAHALVHNRKKLDPKTKPYIFVGYCENTKGYRLIDPEHPTTCIKARDVSFFENKFISNGVLKELHNDNTDLILTQITDCNQSSVQMTKQPDLEPVSNELELSDPESLLSDNMIQTRSGQRRQEMFLLDDTGEEQTFDESMDDASDVTYIPGTLSLQSEESDTRSFISADDSDELASPAFALNCQTDEPTTVNEALSGKEAYQWRDAMQDEYNSFSKNNCWTLTDLKPGQKPVKCKWVFKKKRGYDGRLLKFKARLVAKGFTQKYGIDYQETFAPVVRYSTIRILFAVAVEYDLNIEQLDVKTAFLNGELHEDVVMEQPEGFVVKGKEYKVYKLNKSIYGLKQAAKCWYDKINGVFVKKMFFQKSSVEPCVYFRNQQGGLAIIALYVDDILVFTKSNDEMKEIKKQLMTEFDMKDMGSVHEFLGMRVIREKERITLDQSTYIMSVLNRFKMEDCKSIATPMEAGLKLVKADNKFDNDKYRNLIGCLMYVAVCTRPDIAHAVSVLSQFHECHNETHWKAAKRVLRYLKGTISYRLVFEKSGLKVCGYADADWATCEVDRKSYTGFLFTVGNSVVTWESRKQKTVALSSTEAEYMALSDACKEALFISTFFSECLKLQYVTTLYNDNQSAHKLCENSMFHARTKHIDVRHHFIRDIINRKLVTVKYLATEKMTADILTKPLAKDKFEKMLSELSLKTVIE